MRLVAATFGAGLVALWILWGAVGRTLWRIGLSNAWVVLVVTVVVALLPPLLFARVLSRRRHARHGVGLGRRGWARTILAVFVVAALLPLGFGYRHLEQVLYGRPRAQLERLLGAMRGKGGTASKQGRGVGPRAARGRGPSRAGREPRGRAARPAQDGEISTLPRSKGLLVSTYGGPGVESARAAFAGDGHSIVLGGSYSKSLNLGSTALPAVRRSGKNGFVAKLSSGGEVQWAKAYDHAAVNDVALDDQGNIYVAGAYTRWSSTFDKGGTCKGGALHLFLVKLDQNGERQWAVSGVRRAQLNGHRVAVNRRGEIFLGGWFGPGELELAGKTLEAPPQTSAHFFAKLDGAGRFVWARQLAPFGVSLAELTIAADGELLLAGTFERGLLQLGDHALVNISLDKDIFVAKVDGEGNTRWAKRYGGAQADRVGGLAADPKGGVVLAGESTRGPLDLGAGELDRKIAHDAFIVALDREGKERWSLATAGDNSKVPQAATVDSRGLVYVTGFTYSKRMIVGDLAFLRAGTRDLFLLRIDGDGKAFWAERLAGGGFDASALHVTSGGIFVLGRFSAPTLQLDGASKPRRGPNDLFLTHRELPAATHALKLQATRASPEAPASVLRSEPRPKNPRLDPSTHPYLRSVYLWLGIGLRPMDLDPLRRINTSTSTKVPEERLRLVAADQLVRVQLPAALRARRLADVARGLADLAPIESRERAAAAQRHLQAIFERMKSSKLQWPEREHRVAIYALVDYSVKLLQLDAAPPAERRGGGTVSTAGSKHASAFGKAVVIALALREDERAVARADVCKTMRVLVDASGRAD